MLVRWKDLVLGQLLDTHLMDLRPLEKFLDRFENQKVEIRLTIASFYW